MNNLEILETFVTRHRTKTAKQKTQHKKDE